MDFDLMDQEPVPRLTYYSAHRHLPIGCFYAYRSPYHFFGNKEFDLRAKVILQSQPTRGLFESV